MQKLTSRKFWGAVIVTVCALYMAVFQNADAGTCAAAIAAAWVGYSVAEGYVDGKSAESTQTVNTTSVTATSASQKVVEKAFTNDKDA
ncbi:MAG: hypothetical protein IJH04_00415 [Eggerthellaceae bacterium]|nr:hypothetical protein [Eggerthellaceae bacterium]